MNNYKSLDDMPAKERRALLDKVADHHARVMITDLINNMILESRFDPEEAAERLGQDVETFFEMLTHAVHPDTTLDMISDIAYAFGFTLDFKITEKETIDLPKMNDDILTKEDIK